ncbi:MAG: GumC family protein, partial [bacterium]
KKAPMEEVVEKMRKAIEVNVQQRPSGRERETQNTFTISFEGEEPTTVMMVTNKLASLFIEENLKVREMQAESTSAFLTKELSNIEEQLIKKEEEIRKFRQKHMGQLPQQLDANLRILERLQQQLKTTSDGIKSAEDRMIILQSQIEQLKRPEPAPVVSEATGETASGQQIVISRGRIPEDPIVTQWNQLKRDLESARARYTENHPDIISLKRRIANIEPKAKEILKKQEEMLAAEEREALDRAQTPTTPRQTARAPVRQVDPMVERLILQYTEQYNATLLEAKRLREEEKNLKEQIRLYQLRVEETPKREQELLLLTRDYDLLKANYQSMLDKKIQAQMAESLERKQQGEQFKVLDPARLPEKPIKPDRNRVMLIGAFIGLVAGLGLAWFRETMDQSFHTEADVEGYLNLPVIAVIPNLKEEEKIKA